MAMGIEELRWDLSDLIHRIIGLFTLRELHDADAHEHASKADSMYPTTTDHSIKKVSSELTSGPRPAYVRLPLTVQARYSRQMHQAICP